jgi:hypothetical protein
VKLVHLCNVKDPRLKPYANKNDPRLLSPAAKQWANEVRHSSRRRANLQGRQIINIHPYDGPSIRRLSYLTQNFAPDESKSGEGIVSRYVFLVFSTVCSGDVPADYIHVPFTYLQVKERPINSLSKSFAVSTIPNFEPSNTLSRQHHHGNARASFDQEDDDDWNTATARWGDVCESFYPC